jgi:hypothetical protein
MREDAYQARNARGDAAWRNPPSIYSNTPVGNLSGNGGALDPNAQPRVQALYERTLGGPVPMKPVMSIRASRWPVPKRGPVPGGKALDPLPPREVAKPTSSSMEKQQDDESRGPSDTGATETART